MRYILIIIILAITLSSCAYIHKHNDSLTITEFKEMLRGKE